MIIDEHAKPAFTFQSFSLLESIARSPTAAFYLAHKDAFKMHVEAPLQRVMRREAQLLPGLMRSLLETQRNVFSRFLKNDFGHGGAWSNYWGAFYPRGSRRIADVQLAVWMDYRRVGISFYIGDHAAAPRERFLRNCARWRDEMPRLLGGLLDDQRIHLAMDGKTKGDEQGRMVSETPLGWDEWLDNPARGDYWAFLPLTPAEAVSLTVEDLAHLAAQVHANFFPLALLAMEDHPLPLIHSFNLSGEHPGTNQSAAGI